MTNNKKIGPKVPGDVLGLTDDKTGVKLPHPPSDGSTATGIEVHEHRTAGEGTDTAPKNSAVKLGEEL